MEPNLVSLSQAGDGEAFCKLVEPYEDRLFRQAFLICRDVSRAEDLAQETMVAAWESIGRFDQSCRLFTWLYAIMIRRHRKQIRKLRRRPLLFSDLETLNSGEPYTPLDPGIDDAPNPDEAYLDSERAELLRGMIYKLPLNNREALLLRFYADASLEEIATVQKCSIGTIKSRLFYGLEKLRKMTLTELR